MRLATDGTVAGAYRLCNSCSVGFTADPPNYDGSILGFGDINGDEMLDLAFGVQNGEGRMYTATMLDSDFDGFDDNLDNCPGGPLEDPTLFYNPDQGDMDGDGIGDLCHVCLSVPDPLQVDSDGDGQGDLCEPLILSL